MAHQLRARAVGSLRDADDLDESEVSGAEHAVDRRLGADVAAFVCKQRHDLRGRLVAKAWARNDADDAPTFHCRETVRGRTIRSVSTVLL
jgi:hypothetical protein